MRRYRRGCRAAVAMYSAVVVGLSFAGVAATPQPAPAATLSPVTVHLPDGTSVQLPRPLPAMSLAELAVYDIAPGQHGVRAGTLRAVSTQAAARPHDALGQCNSSWCEDVHGRGTVVVEWFGYNPWPVPYLCGYGTFWEPSTTIWGITNETCGSQFETNINGNLPHAFGNNTLACATFVGIVGKPCTTIHS